MPKWMGARQGGTAAGCGEQLVNLRREFFYATPEEVRDIILELEDEHLLEFTSEATSEEWRPSIHPMPGDTLARPNSLL